MTHPQTAAMIALLERVEAGEATLYDFQTWRPGLTGTRKESALMHKAYSGDLNAAKSVHNSLLGDGNISTPGYMATVYMSGKAAVWDIISGASFRGEVNAPSLHSVSPARAWLIAVLRALIADTEGR
jgi:hypothetical protein